MALCNCDTLRKKDNYSHLSSTRAPAAPVKNRKLLYSARVVGRTTKEIAHTKRVKKEPSSIFMLFDTNKETRRPPTKNNKLLFIMLVFFLSNTV